MMTNWWICSDLAQGLGKRIKPLLTSDQVTYVLKTAAGSQQAQTRELAVWAREVRTDLDLH